jgi:protein-S-isoprenylcysteine O-methyltransferase Ste14
VRADLYHLTGWLALPLYAAQVAGLWLIARAVSRIDPLELAGIRQVQQSSDAAGLQTTGPYRWVRHPIYLGWVLLVFGVPHMTGDRLTFAAISTAYVVIAIPWEERSLLRDLGEQYARYRRAVRWRIIPYLY